MSRLRSFARMGAAAGAAMLLALSGPAHAQMAVFDSANYAKLLQETQTALKQLQQLEQQVAQGEQLVTNSQQLLTSLNQISNVNGLATVLEQPTLRSFLPNGSTYVTASSAGGNLSTLGVIGQAAQVIRTANQLFTAPSGSAYASLTTSGNQAALNLATGQAVVQAGATRLTGLQQLQTAIDAAPNARAVAEIEARLQAEEAMIANDQMRIQGLAMTQAAQAQMLTQQNAERAAAASQARLSLYQSAFQ
jgi:type IV secretion system protein VirB5